MSECPYKIFYWNCAAGFIGKWELVKYWIDFEKPDAFFISEADIHRNIDLRMFCVPGYKVDTCNTLEINGKSRMICWYRNFFNRVTDLEHLRNEIIVLKHRKSIIVGLYRPFKCYDG